MVSKSEVKKFWEAEACGERYGSSQDRLRYEMEPEILALADFGQSARKSVLEIGVGMGADFIRWVKAGANATGIDFTERAVAMTNKRLVAEGLHADVQVADAELLPFEDGQFDIVYSWGVLHHTPDPERALSEAQRVLAPGGELKLMIYHRHSWVALAAWLRFSALKGRPFANLREAVAQIESPGTRAFTCDEIRSMLTQMSTVDVQPSLTRWDRKWAPLISRLTGHRYGWFLLIRASKAG